MSVGATAMATVRTATALNAGVLRRRRSAHGVSRARAARIICVLQTHQHRRNSPWPKRLPWLDSKLRDVLLGHYRPHDPDPIWRTRRPAKRLERSKWDDQLFLTLEQEDMVSYYTHTFGTASTFQYKDGVTASTPLAQVSVPVSLPESGAVGQPFAVSWSMPTPAPGIVFDLEVRLPGQPDFTPWESSAQAADNYTPALAGHYQFRARMRLRGRCGAVLGTGHDSREVRLTSEP